MLLQAASTRGAANAVQHSFQYRTCQWVLPQLPWQTPSTSQHISTCLPRLQLFRFRIACFVCSGNWPHNPFDISCTRAVCEKNNNNIIIIFGLFLDTSPTTTPCEQDTVSGICCPQTFLGYRIFFANTGII